LEPWGFLGVIFRDILERVAMGLDGKGDFEIVIVLGFR